jgi:hypothetical protein
MKTPEDEQIGLAEIPWGLRGAVLLHSNRANRVRTGAPCLLFTHPPDDRLAHQKIHDEREQERRDDREKDHREAAHLAAERPHFHIASNPHVLPLLFDGHLTLGVAGSSRACSVHRFRASLPRSTDASARTPLVSSKFGLAPCVLRTAVRSCSAYESSSASYAPPVLRPATPFMLQFLVYLALSGRPVFRALHACASPLRRRPKQRSRNSRRGDHAFVILERDVSTS